MLKLYQKKHLGIEDNNCKTKGVHKKTYLIYFSISIQQFSTVKSTLKQLIYSTILSFSHASTLQNKSAKHTTELLNLSFLYEQMEPTLGRPLCFFQRLSSSFLSLGSLSVANSFTMDSSEILAVCICTDAFPIVELPGSLRGR